MKPLRLLTTQSPTCFKVHLALCALAEADAAAFTFASEQVDMITSAHKKVDYLALCPNGKLPCLIDANIVDEAGQPCVVWESTAILLHLIEYYDSQQRLGFPHDKPLLRSQLHSWLCWSHAGLASNGGQAIHFTYAAPGLTSEPVGYSAERYRAEVKRLLNVLDSHLQKDDKEWVVGSRWSAADASILPWTLQVVYMGLEPADVPARVRAWQERNLQLTHVRKGLSLIGPNAPIWFYLDKMDAGQWKEWDKFFRQALPFMTYTWQTQDPLQPKGTGAAAAGSKVPNPPSGPPPAGGLDSLL